MAFVGATISRPRADTIRPYKTDDSKKARGNMNCSALFYARRAWRSFSMARRSSRETCTCDTPRVPAQRLWVRPL